jgi:CYTH domain-containing protein
VEEERRFLLSEPPTGLATTPFIRIFDHYLDGTRLRLRRIESPSGEVLGYKFGQKYRGVDQSNHQTMMTNIYLNDIEYRKLSQLGGKLLVKRRFSYQHADLHYSIDIFEGPLDGLILAEIESQLSNVITDLPMPRFAIREVTDEPQFTGRSLAEMTEAEFQEWIKSW